MKREEPQKNHDSAPTPIMVSYKTLMLMDKLQVFSIICIILTV